MRAERRTADRCVSRQGVDTPTTVRNRRVPDELSAELDRSFTSERRARRNSQEALPSTPESQLRSARLEPRVTRSLLLTSGALRAVGRARYACARKTPAIDRLRQRLVPRSLRPLPPWELELIGARGGYRFLLVRSAKLETFSAQS
jgi:hypothetical protein